MATKKAENTIRIELDKPIKFQGKDLDVIEIKVDELTGRDMMNARNIAVAKGDQAAELPISMAYRLAVVQVATGIPYDTLLEMSASSFNLLMRETMSFTVGE